METHVADFPLWYLRNVQQSRPCDLLMIEQHGCRIFPFFTDDDLANRFAKNSRIFQAVPVEREEIDAFLGELEERGYTHVVIDPAWGFAATAPIQTFRNDLRTGAP